ncbi:MAG: thiol-disulfide oxidoreductase [Flavobacteriaceae bacterium]|nr:thiol-disulfide oxidoreductase [Flavobacteriaceae bacterium]|tara:strand:- start:524 stop:910 length:387 start_codon:yes stop_codon:yes gene_type:complete
MKKDIIVFDGLCVMCNSFLKWVLKNDKGDKYLFANIQSDFYKKSMDINKSIDSIILIKENNIFYESEAIKHILKDLGKFYVIQLVLDVTPTFISNFFYKIIANNRYKIFGKKDKCELPKKNQLSKFLK